MTFNIKIKDTNLKRFFSLLCLCAFTIVSTSCSRSSSKIDPEQKSDSTGHNESKGGTELFYSDYPYAFVSTSTDEPVMINGVNIIRAPPSKCIRDMANSIYK